jgi:hypothetical protein
MKYLYKIKKISKSPKYFKIYSQIICRGQKKFSHIYKLTSIHYAKKIINRNGAYIYEAHHILPKCLCENENQKKDITNICFLTIKEHLLCHKILALKICPENASLKRAFFATFRKRNIKQIYRMPTLREVEFFKKHSKELFIKSGEENGMYGKKHSEETKHKIRLKAMGRKPSKRIIEKMKISQQKNKKNNSWNQILKHNSNIKAKCYDDLEKKICELYKSGKQNMSWISKELNFSTTNCGVIKRILTENKLPIPSPTWSKIVKKYGYRWKNMNEFTAELKDLYSNGMNINRISKHLGLNDWIVTSTLRNSD